MKQDRTKLKARLREIKAAQPKNAADVTKLLDEVNNINNKLTTDEGTQIKLEAPRDLTKTTDIGFALRDLLAGKPEFPTFCPLPYKGRWQEVGADMIAGVDVHNPNALRLTTAKGQRFTVRIFAG